MTNDDRRRLRAWLESGQAHLHPLALTQRELWEGAPYPAADPSNHIGGLIFVRGPVRRPLLEQALARVVARQEVLRLSVLQGRAEPVQLVREDMPSALSPDAGTDFSGNEQAIEEAAEVVFAEPFDLARGPLYRMHAVERGPNDHVLALTIHHAIADGWSIGVFMDDLWTSYISELLGQEAAASPVDLTYGRWANDERLFWTADEIGRRTGFWKRSLAGAPRVLDAASTPTGRRRRLRSRLAADRVESVRAVVRRTGATLFATLLAAFRLTLAEWRGGTDILVGTPVANRTRMAARTTMGSFAGIVPLRGEVRTVAAFSDHVTQARDETAEAFAQALPFVALVEAIGEVVTPGRNPVFDVRFALQNHPMPEVSYPGLSIRMHLLSTGTARFDLGCEVTEVGDEMEVVWLYRDDIFARADIEALNQLWCEVLDAACREILGAGD